MVYERSPWAFRHFVLGAIAIFVYVGIEVGIPGAQLYLSNTEMGAWVDAPANAATIGGFVASTYWFLMLVGRFIGSLVGGRSPAGDAHYRFGGRDIVDPWGDYRAENHHYLDAGIYRFIVCHDRGTSQRAAVGIVRVVYLRYVGKYI